MLDNLNGSRKEIQLGTSYILTSKIGKGATSSIYLGYSVHDKLRKLYAFKIINPNKENSLSYYNREISALTNLSHPNIVQIHDFGNTQLIKPGKPAKQVYYIKIEYFQNGPLFDYIFFPKQGLGEPLAKVVMHYLINALEHLHSKNFVHRDLKTENIMLDDFFNIKLADFGFCQNKSKNNDGILETILGTKCYVSPELFNHRRYYGVPNDIFAAGVIMFVLVTGNMPFQTATYHDCYYRYFYQGNYEEYWEHRGVEVSQEFKELFCACVAVDYTIRPSLGEFKFSKWMSGINYNDLGQLKKVLKKRKIIVDLNKQSNFGFFKNSTGNNFSTKNETITSNPNLSTFGSVAERSSNYNNNPFMKPNLFKVMKCNH